MKFNIVLSVAGIILLYATGCLCQLDVCGRAPLNDRISGGENATAGVWPWQVSIHDIQLGHHYCGGTLIAKDWVLAGAHCFDRTVSRVIVHPDYGHPPFDKDIALVQLSSSVPFSDYIRPVCLAAAGSVFDAGTESWVTGWGYLQPEGPVSDMLQEVMLPVVSNSDCDHAYTGVVGITITNNMICSGQDGKSVCPGDSGGPMVSRKGSLWIQSGITLMSENQCNAELNYPSLFIRVSQYQDWIQSNTGSDQPGFVDFNAASNSNFNLLLFPLSLSFSFIPFRL
ncbi:chymotrypsin-like protease CTRL-1 [Labeo rohita]|uniref:Chymotrypsin-like protease CTRL-1 n=1 Tax=Labeo rohita TaxID=84645 RepID=A0A498M9Q9_LABRO|nr:chymotrypsin-like protease CTRL-1 [Labeo rohita]